MSPAIAFPGVSPRCAPGCNPKIAFKTFTSADTASLPMCKWLACGPPARCRGWPFCPLPPDAAFPNISEWLSTEEVMDLLSGARYAIASLVAQDSVFTLARRGLAAQEIGTALRADLVLTGQLLAIQGHDRLRAEMIRAEDGAQLWIEDLLRERGRIGALSSGAGEPPQLPSAFRGAFYRSCRRARRGG